MSIFEGKRIFAIRGAICSENTKDDIFLNTEKLCCEIFEKNKIKAEDLVSIQFSLTPDLNQLNPATALRKGNTGLDTSKVALFCCQEALIEGMMEKVIRVMVTVYLDEKAKIFNIYQNGAEKLRPDFAKEYQEKKSEKESGILEKLNSVELAK